jgi:hypothetical protein
MVVLREAAAPGRFSLAIRLDFLVLPLLGILLAALGWRRRAAKWSAVAIAVAVLSIVTLLILSSRTWGTTPAGGASRWQSPTFDWPG